MHLTPHRPRNFIEIELPSGGSLKDMLVYDIKDDATAATESYSDDSDSSSSSNPSSKVRFDMAATIAYPNSSIEFEDLQELCWYSRAEYKLFRRHTQAIAKQVTAIEQQNVAIHSYERVVTRIYKQCCESTTTTATTEGSPAAESISSADRRHLNQWSQAAPVRHGLDKWALTKLAKQRSLQRHELRETIVQLQRRIIRDEYFGENLRLTSERLSQGSRLFAQCMAASLATAERSVQSMA